jgi:hypothetical protein
MNRELKRSDLPKTRSSGKSLHLPVITKRGVKKYVCDIHFGDETLCYLEGAKGKPTKISSLLIEDKTLKMEGLIEYLRDNSEYLSIRGIENKLQMPFGILTKAINGSQRLSDKWLTPLSKFLMGLQNPKSVGKNLK